MVTTGVLRSNLKSILKNSLNGIYNEGKIYDVLKIYDNLPKENKYQFINNIIDEERSLDIFKYFSKSEKGIKFLVDLRAEISSAYKSPHTKEIIKINEQLKNLLEILFSPGLLDLQEITLNSPKLILENLIKYETIHPIKDWAELEKRFKNNKKVYIYTHKCLPNEPIVIIYCYLTEEIANNVEEIIECKATTNTIKYTTAIFYSLTVTQIGNYIIKDTVKRLKKEIPFLETFSTLSPIPGFNKWINQNYKDFKFTNTKWFDSEECTSSRPKLMDLCKHYLIDCKHSLNTKVALNYVADFHLKNGATLYRLNWMGDKSQNGFNNSYGIMVNYRYYLEKLNDNALNYVINGYIDKSHLL